MSISPYKYKMIRGIDFYDYILNFLAKKPNMTFSQESISEITEDSKGAKLVTSENTYEGDYIFKSYPDRLDNIKDYFVWQHFKGWVVQSKEPFFDPSRATLMDFRMDQGDDTRFFYLLPTSETEALVELAIFSPSIPDSTYYDSYLESYLKKDVGLKSWTITHEEVGAIPMTSHNFQTDKSKRVIRIGTNGGAVKASSGYAFTRVQKQVASVMRQIASGQFQPQGSTRYDLYDKVLLNAILKGKTTGKEVFDGLFKNLSGPTIFRFLDGEGSLWTDLKVFTGPPTLPFLKAFIEEVS